jgi:PAS domain S-box-containing protein
MLNLDLKTLTLISSLLFLTQFLAVHAQYRTNRAYPGIRPWLLGSALMALSCFLMPLVAVPSLRVLGYLGVYVGIADLLRRPRDLGILAALFGAFLAGYYYCLFVSPGIMKRTAVLAIVTAILFLRMAYRLYSHREANLAATTRFTGTVFLGYGLFSVVRIYPALTAQGPDTYLAMAPIHVLAFVLPLVASSLWTFGFILMVNQRLTNEVLEERDTYRSILHATPDDITITDLEGRILLTSPVANRMFGYEVGEEAGRRIQEFLVPEDQERAQAHILRMLRGGSVGPAGFRGVRKDGSVFELEVTSGLCRAANGQSAKIVFIARDLTERRLAEARAAELEVRNRQLAKAESLGRMAGAVAHHFNNHLQAVLGNLDLLAAQPSGADPAPYVANAREAVQRASLVSGMMLSYLGRTPREQKTLSLASLCVASLPLLQETLPHGVGLATDLPQPGPVIRANPEQVRSILANLVTNAWEALEGAQGTVSLRAGVCAPSEVSAQNRFPADWEPQGTAYAYLEVGDEAGGIPAEDLEKVFDPFYSTKFTGRGLGLPMVLGLAQAHGGVVTVENRPGEGSTFRVYFPVADHG